MSFGHISKLKTTADSLSVNHIEKDIHTGEGHIVYCHNTAIITRNTHTGVEKILYKSDSIQARITSFAQLESDSGSIIFVTSNRNQLFEFHLSDGKVGAWAGSEQKEVANGNATAGSFFEPHYIAVDQVDTSYPVMYVAEPKKNVIRNVSIHIEGKHAVPEHIGTFVTLSKDHFPLSLLVHREYKIKMLLVGGVSSLVRFWLDYHHSGYQYNSENGPEQDSYSDGVLYSATFSNISSMGFVASRVLLLADKGHRRIRIVNIEEHQTYTLCLDVTNQIKECKCGICSPQTVLSYDKHTVLIGQNDGLYVMTGKKIVSRRNYILPQF